MSASQQMFALHCAKMERYRAMRHYQRVAKRLLQRPVEMRELNAVYATGLLPAVFPMPAIPLAVTIDYEFTAIWHVGVGCMYYRDDHETMFAY